MARSGLGVRARVVLLNKVFIGQCIIVPIDIISLGQMLAPKSIGE